MAKAKSSAANKNYQNFKFKVRALFKTAALGRAYGMSNCKILNLKKQAFPKSYKLISELDNLCAFIEELKRTD